MPNKKNITTLNDLQEKIASAKSVFLTNYLGLKVAQMQTLKNNVKQVEGEFTVTKNTLLNLALKNLGFETPKNFELRDDTAMLLSFKDEVAPLKKLVEFTKENLLPKLKFGFLEKKFLDFDQTTELSIIPGKDILLTRLVLATNSPIYGTYYALKGNLQKLATILNNYKSKKETEVSKNV